MRSRVIESEIFISIAHRLLFDLIFCFGLSKMAAVFSLQVVLVALLCFCGAFF